MSKLGTLLIAALISHTLSLAWTPSTVVFRFTTSLPVNHNIILTFPSPKESATTLRNKLSTVEEDTENSPKIATEDHQSLPPKPLQTAATTDKSYGKGVWVPPSQNISQRKGKVFAIKKPQDLLDFVIEDERLSVGKITFTEFCFCRRSV